MLELLFDVLLRFAHILGFHPAFHFLEPPEHLRAGGEIRSTTLSQPSLESLFIKLTGKELRE